MPLELRKKFQFHAILWVNILMINYIRNVKAISMYWMFLIFKNSPKYFGKSKEWDHFLPKIKQIDNYVLGDFSFYVTINCWCLFTGISYTDDTITGYFWICLCFFFRVSISPICPSFWCCMYSVKNYIDGLWKSRPTDFKLNHTIVMSPENKTVFTLFLPSRFCLPLLSKTV